MQRRGDAILDEHGAMNVTDRRGEQRAPCVLTEAIVQGPTDPEITLFERAGECKHAEKLVRIHGGVSIVDECYDGVIQAARKVQSPAQYANDTHPRVGTEAQT